MKRSTLIQGVKFLLVGGIATVIDLVVFEILAFLIHGIPGVILLSKAISFIIATILKFGGNKYWTFERHHHHNLAREIVQFLAVTIVALFIDLIAFSLSIHVLSSSLSVIVAALASALWSFLGYKFFVFKEKSRVGNPAGLEERG